MSKSRSATTSAKAARIVQVARKTGRICQGGTQNRSNGALAAAVEYMRQGKLGEVKLARSIVYGRRGSIGGPGKCEIPGERRLQPLGRPGADGPADAAEAALRLALGLGHRQRRARQQQHPLARHLPLGPRRDGLGRSVVSYGGRLGYSDAGETPNTQVCVFDFGDKTIVSETRGLKTEPFHPNDQGRLDLLRHRRHHRRHLAVRSRRQAGPHVRRQERQSISPTFSMPCAAGSGKTSKPKFSKAINRALCHIGNISWRLGRTASPAELRSEVGKREVHENVLETLDRTLAHLAANEVNIEKTPLTMGLHLQLDGEAFVGNEPRKPYAVTRLPQALRGAEPSLGIHARETPLSSGWTTSHWWVLTCQAEFRAFPSQGSCSLRQLMIESARRRPLGRP